MRLELKLHPDCTCRAVRRIEVEVARPRPNRLALCYIVSGDCANIVSPAPKGVGDRADQLWKHTCFEAFVRTPPGASYVELNAATSGDWAAYHFSDYRQGMRIALDAALASSSERFGPDTMELARQFDLTGAAPGAAAWRLGLAAVIEEKDGALSYWALHHAPGKPDFHHADSFAYELKP